jgi:hypothetical protein
MLGVDAANAELVRIALKAGKFNAGDSGVEYVLYKYKRLICMVGGFSSMQGMPCTHLRLYFSV